MKKRNGKLPLLALWLTLIALGAATAATLAWLTISSNARVSMLKLDVAPSPELHMDLVEHDDYNDYPQSLSGEDIFTRIQQDYGFDPRNTPMDPVTTPDGRRFYFQDGSSATAQSGAYWTFTLHFMAPRELDVYLTQVNSRDTTNGTRLTSGVPNLTRTMRISFAGTNGIAIYAPVTPQRHPYDKRVTLFTLPGDQQAVYEDNFLVHLPANTDVPLTLALWMEGTDPYCDNSLKYGDFSLQLRFIGKEEGIIPQE